MNYDLEERTKKFSKEVIRFLKIVNKNEINKNLIFQLVRSATGVGANYCEGIGASSKKDFRNKMFICRKEIQETRYWTEMMAESNPENKDELRKLWQEAHELTLIFNKITSSFKN
jgi:four helix bundle protein